jgi:two-component system, NarL family, nitrate/nitrite response regulator NarL
MQQIRHLMLIDDSDIDLFIQQKVVEITSFALRVSAFLSPQEALDYLVKANPEQLPELIFLDLNMPIMDGFAVLDEMSSHPSTILHNYKVVILTSSNSLKDKEKAKDYAFVKGFISKPLTEVQIDHVRQLMHER